MFPVLFHLWKENRKIIILSIERLQGLVITIQPVAAVVDKTICGKYFCQCSLTYSRVFNNFLSRRLTFKSRHL